MKSKDIKNYGLLSLGVILTATGFAGLSYTDKIATKLNKKSNIVSGIAGALTIIGALTSVLILDKSLYPEDDDIEDEKE